MHPKLQSFKFSIKTFQTISIGKFKCCKFPLFVPKAVQNKKHFPFPKLRANCNFFKINPPPSLALDEIN
ncbi:hypothetical protein T07_13071 [Trichinella nelsoni]|uniref:Uncharacterized protein n=1 Tax=Trichinella nelsoni TaxID=6336 RepID=A0A0V0S2S6_9BILA|nr:hypothetical protein T07_13071 [Trichinella nelsoni]